MRAAGPPRLGLPGPVLERPHLRVSAPEGRGGARPRGAPEGWQPAGTAAAPGEAVAEQPPSSPPSPRPPTTTITPPALQHVAGPRERRHFHHWLRAPLVQHHPPHAPRLDLQLHAACAPRQRSRGHRLHRLAGAGRDCCGSRAGRAGIERWRAGDSPPWWPSAAPRPPPPKPQTRTPSSSHPDLPTAAVHSCRRCCPFQPFSSNPLLMKSGIHACLMPSFPSHPLFLFGLPL